MTRHLPENKTDVLIIGGGASGLAAACIALLQGCSVRVLEARERVGKKLLATGNGRCNLLNTGPPVYYGEGAAFALETLAACSVRDVLAFFHGLGLTTIHEDGGLVYPAVRQAAAVLDVLRIPLEQSGHCEILCNSPVQDITIEAQGPRVHCADGRRYDAHRVIVAAGGPAQPQLSGDDSIYAPLLRLGHRLVPPRPALSALVTDKQAVAGLKGLRVPAICTLTDGETPIARAEGEVLFAQDGISGVCVMQLSRDAGQLLTAGGQPTVYLDFSPLLGLAPRRMQRSPAGAPGENEGAILAFLRDRGQHLPPEQVLTGAVPRLLAARVQGATLHDTAHLLGAYPLAVRDVRGFEHAQVAAGGIDTRDVMPRTMRSRLHPALYLCGEVLDVDGDCGGHNLLFAWASGLLAGRAQSAI